MRIFLTGVAGFIGASVARSLLEKGHSVSGVDSLNAYYDPTLKRARLARLEGLDGFSFLQTDIADAKALARAATGESFDVIAHAIDDADKLMPNDHRHLNRFLRPCVPVVNVHVGSADGCFQHANQHIVAADFWNRNIFEPETRLTFSLHNRLHQFLHEQKLGESGTQESMKVRE